MGVACVVIPRLRCGLLATHSQRPLVTSLNNIINSTTSNMDSLFSCQLRSSSALLAITVQCVLWLNGWPF